MADENIEHTPEAQAVEGHEGHMEPAGQTAEEHASEASQDGATEERSDASVQGEQARARHAAEDSEAPELETVEEPPREEVVAERAAAVHTMGENADRVNWVDGKAEKIADPLSTAEAAEGVDTEGRSPFAPTPWRETNPKLDNRPVEGAGAVTAESWAEVPQHVPGPNELPGSNDPRPDPRG